MATGPQKTLIGLVGCYPFVPGYPLGSAFVDELKAVRLPESVEIRELNWGPLAIVQDMQARQERFLRVVLVGVVDRGGRENAISCYQWRGGTIPPAALQERMFEAVTGVVHLDNLLAIGDHFGVWPGEVISVELQRNRDSVGDYVMESMAQGNAGAAQGAASGRALSGDMLDEWVNRTCQAARHGVEGLTGIQPLSAEALTPVAQVCQNRDVGTNLGNGTH